MSKKKNWLARVKGIFFPDKDEHEEQLKSKRKKKKRWVFGWERTTEKPPSLAAPLLSRGEQAAHQSLPVASPAPSEEAGARLSTTNSGLILPTRSSFGRQCEESAVAKILLHRAQLLQEHAELLAAIKIQTAFRGYLARKALRALKGLVRLQAMIRGRAVRRQAIATLKSLQSIVNIQSQVCATRYQKASEDPKIEQSFQRRRDHTLLMKDDEHDILLSKTEAMLRRNRLKAHSFNHRHSADVEDVRIVGRLRRWLEKYEECDMPTKEEIKRVDTVGGKQLMRVRNPLSHEAAEASAMAPPRSSFESRQRGRATSQPGSRLDGPPAYMAATESARARVRSMSSARLVRPTRLESYSDGDSPYKTKLSPMSFVNSERNCIGGAVGAMTPSRSYGGHIMRSCTGLKGIGGSMRWNRNVPDSGPENGRWLMNWN